MLSVGLLKTQSPHLRLILVATLIRPTVERQLISAFIFLVSQNKALSRRSFETDCLERKAT
jgi:hypothetical protein